MPRLILHIPLLLRLETTVAYHRATSQTDHGFASEVLPMHSDLAEVLQRHLDRVLATVEKEFGLAAEGDYEVRKGIIYRFDPKTREWRSTGVSRSLLNSFLFPLVPRRVLWF